MITLTAYNPNWQTDFQDEKNRLSNLGLTNIVTIEHIGSTAISGLIAKPVIDILIGVSDLTAFTAADSQRIESLGYRYNPVFETVFPFRRYFQKENAQGIRTHQIHLVNYPSQWYEKHLLFRNYLRYNRDSAHAYETLKRELAQQFDNTIDYANAKNDFCQAVGKKAFSDFNVNRPFLESDHLVALIPQLGCHHDYATMLQDSEFCNAYGVTYSDDDALLRLQSDINYWNQYAFAPWMWYEKKTHAYVGRGGLKRFKRHPNDVLDIELTYQMKRDYWNRGFAQEVGRMSLHYAFNHLRLNSIICFTAYNNDPSLRVMQQLGFRLEGEFIHADVVHTLHRLLKPGLPS